MKWFTPAAAVFVMLTALGQASGQTVSLVADIYPGEYGSYPQAFTLFNDELYFVARDSASSAQLWKTDGTAVSIVAEMNHRITPGPGEMGAIFRGELYYAGYDADAGIELWKTDGVNSVRVADIYPGSTLRR